MTSIARGLQVNKDPDIASITAVWAKLSKEYPSTQFLGDLRSIDLQPGSRLYVVVSAWAAWWYARPGPHADAVADVLSAAATFLPLANPQNPPAPQPLPQALQPLPTHAQPQPQQQPHLPSGGRQQQTQAAEAEQSAATDQVALPLYSVFDLIICSVCFAWCIACAACSFQQIRA